MKKILAMTAVAAFALGASSAVNGDELLNGTTFVDLTVGEKLNIDLTDAGIGTGDKYWSVDDTSKDLDCVITNGVFEPPSGVARPSQWLNTDNGETRKYLLVEAERDNRLYRNINSAENNNAPMAIGDGLYFDSLVQFTATDTLPEVSAGDKLVVWLYGGEADSNDVLGLGEEGKVSTNLVVTAGYVVGESTVTTNYVVDLPAGIEVLPNSWHRLTIKAVNNIAGYASTKALAGFVVYIDEKAVTCDEARSEDDFADIGGLTNAAGDLGNKLFPSLLQPGDVAASTLTSVAFEGTGAIDDLVFTTTDPFPEAVPFEYTVTVADEEGASGDTTFAVDGGSAQAFTSGTPIAVPVTATTIDFVVKVYNGFKLSNSGAVKGATVDQDGYYDWTFSVAVSTLAKDGTDTLTLSVVEDSGAATTYTLTLTQGTGTTLTASVGGSNVNTGAEIDDGAQVTIAAALSDDTAYENLVVTVDGVPVTLTNGEYTFTMTAATTVATSATAKQQPSENWATGEDLDTMGGKSVEATYGITGDLANADAKVFTTWASGVGGVAYADKGTTTYNVECFLLNIANNSSPEDIAAAKATASAAIKITAISVDNGVVTITAPSTYGNGKVVVQGSVALTPASWHAKAAGDYFFRTALVVDEIE